MNLPAWKQYLQYFRGSLRKLGLVILVSVGQSLIFVLIAYIVRYAFDQLVSSGATSRLVGIGGVLLFLVALTNGLNLWTRAITRKITTLAICDMRDDLLRKIISFPRTTSTSIDSGRMHASLVQDTQRLDIMNNSIVTKSLPSAVILVGLVSVLIYLNWALFAVLLVTFLPLIFLSRITRKRIRDEVNLYHRSLEKLSKGILFILQTMDLVRGRSAEGFEVRRQKERHDEMRQRSYSLVWASGIYNSVTNSIVAVSGIVILVVGGLAVGAELMTLGELLSFYVVIGFMRGNVNSLLASIPLVIEGDECLTALYTVLGMDDRQPYQGTKQISFQGGVRLADVNYGYAGEPLLCDTNLVIRPGETVALMGPNGVGKSTIAHLISGYYRPGGGSLIADDYPYDELDMGHFRRSIGVVQQDPILFSGTIRENITYGWPEADPALVKRACGLATAEVFIGKLPDGYDTLVGENGVRLSGGERKKIAIARALLREPRLLIFDEPANHLDRDALGELLRNLKQLDPQPAILIITHDRAIAAHAQEIHIFTSKGQLRTFSDSSQFLQNEILNKT
jgi:ATP-binding cassette, subfamily B, bacterial